MKNAELTVNDEQRHIAALLGAVLSRGYVVTNGVRRTITGNVTLEEAGQIAGVVLTERCTTTAETGVAFGISTLAICAALHAMGNVEARHFGIDPNQLREYGGAALKLLQEHGFDHHFQLLNGPTHLEAPKLVEQGLHLDFGFIDGWHTFDYTLLDFFYIDKLLRPGGIVGFHDSYGPTKRKVFRFLMSHRRYRRLPIRRVPIRRWLRSVAAGICHVDKSVIYRLDRLPSLCFFQKVESWEPNYDFYARF